MPKPSPSTPSCTACRRPARWAGCGEGARLPGRRTAAGKAAAGRAAWHAPASAEPAHPLGGRRRPPAGVGARARQPAGGCRPPVHALPGPGRGAGAGGCAGPGARRGCVGRCQPSGHTQHMAAGAEQHASVLLQLLPLTAPAPWRSTMLRPAAAEHGATPAALRAYESFRQPLVNKAGPAAQGVRAAAGAAPLACLPAGPAGAGVYLAHAAPHPPACTPTWSNRPCARRWSRCTAPRWPASSSSGRGGRCHRWAWAAAGCAGRGCMAGAASSAHGPALAMRLALLLQELETNHRLGFWARKFAPLAPLSAEE